MKSMILKFVVTCLIVSCWFCAVGHGEGMEAVTCPECKLMITGTSKMFDDWGRGSIPPHLCKTANRGCCCPLIEGGGVSKKKVKFIVAFKPPETLTGEEINNIKTGLMHKFPEDVRQYVTIQEKEIK